TAFVAEISLTNFGTALQSTTTTGTSADFTGLTGDTSHYLRVSAVSYDGIATSPDVVLTTVTRPAAASALAPTGVGAAALTANWTTTANAADSIYEAVLSTDGFSSVGQSSRTTGGSATFSGLTANTTYEMEVRTIGRLGDVSAFTLLPSTRTQLNA